MEEQNERRITMKAWSGILIAATIITMVALNRAGDPTGTQVVVTFLLAFGVSIFGWALCSLGWEYGRKQ